MDELLAAVGRSPNFYEGFADGVVGLASGQRVDGDACLSWSCCESLRSD